MRKPLQLILLLGLVALVTVGTCSLTRFLMPSRRQTSAEDAHAWIHQQLKVTPAQEAALDPLEARYSQRRNQLMQAIREANAKLALVMLEDRADTLRVKVAIEKIHAAQGELQMVTIAHIFEMKAALTPEQGDKLLQMTAEALKSEAGGSH
jgi:Spy/CpxP family protein refolding chaperone